MYRGRNNNNGNNDTGRGRGEGRGRGRGRGEGRAHGRGRGQTRGRGRGGGPDSNEAANANGNVNGGRGGWRGRARGGTYDLSAERDAMMQMYPDYTTGVPLPSHANSPSQRGYRGRGIGSPQRGRGGGYESPNYRGRKHNPNAPLSALLAASRPYLRPIKFVRSVHNATLFEHQEEEELMKPLVEEVGDDEQQHVPTAERVARVFSGSIPAMPSTETSDDELEEIDFADLGRVQAEVDAVAASGSVTQSNADVELVEERFTGIWIDKPKLEVPAVVDSTTMTTSDVTSTIMSTTITSESSITSSSPPPSPPPIEPPLFFVDTVPAQVAATDAPAQGSERSLAEILQRHSAAAREPVQEDSDDEIIVYVAPHPRKASGRIRTPSPPPTSQISPLELTTTSILTGKILEREPVVPVPAFSSISFSALPSIGSSGASPRKVPPTAALTPHGRTKAKLKARVVGKRAQRRAGAFGGFGAMLAEARLRGEDPRKDQRRKGDSDIDWGDSNDDEGLEEDETGMQVDADLDAGALARFAKGLLSQEGSGSRWVTMDDVEDEKRMRDEDESEVVRGESGDDSEEESGDEELNAVLDAEEAAMIGEDASEEEDDDSDDDIDIDQSPNSAFQTRLDRLRKAAREKEKAADDSMDQIFWDDDDDSGADDFLERTWRQRDDDFAAKLQAVLDENGDILASTSRRGRKALLKASVNGDVDIDDFDFEAFGQPAKKKKRSDIPAELQDTWERDRAKKAENKRQRALARLEAAADPLAAHKGGKKGRKAMLAAARLDPTITVLPNRIIDMTTLVQQIRRFIADLGGATSMSLPPTDKATRKSVHELATVFGLKSVSKGKGEARYTTLSKTTKTGMRVDEKKVAWMCRRGGARGTSFVAVSEGGGSGGGARAKGKGRAIPVMPRQRDGDEVGKAAPKIGESNIGFKMLASMGWSEGQRIGAAADGLHVPLMAVIKNTKLGLGATR
ncbi:hypothetical protein C8F01DRAFT_1060646 [Mycena amicta]|nr:hypothetical protein C8F01DRAFT_1060646 [Mycena amicta]